MSLTAISYRPVFRDSPRLLSRFKSPKAISFHGFPSSRPFFFGVFASRRLIYKRIAVFRRKATIEFIKTAALGRSDDDEGAWITDEEAILSNGSSEFHPNSLSVGLEPTLNRLSKWLVAAVFGAVILFRHDVESLWAAMGGVVNVRLSTTLKQILNQERPIPTSKSDPGMPSSHAQSIFFTVVFAVLSLVEWLGINELTVTVGALAFACGSYLSWLRVSQQYHTISQVVVGAIFGFIFSILWFWSWHAIVLNAFISYLWVRVVVVLGSAGFFLAFLQFVFRHWFMDEQ